MSPRTRTPRLWIAAIAAAALIGLALTTPRAQAYPEPSSVLTSWQLDFSYPKPQTIAVRLAGEDQASHYRYITYTVTNNTGKDRLFVPEVEILTDAGDLIQANRGIPPAVFRAIENREDNPLLKNPVQVVGRILQGEDHAKDSVIIWKAPDHDVDNVRLFLAGLSGETREIEDPKTGETRVLRKTLMLEYNTPGDTRNPGSTPFELENEQWILR